MSTAQKVYNDFFKNFGGQSSFTKQDIYNYFLSEGKSLSDGAIRWRIHDLKNAGILKSIERSVYSINTKSCFISKTSTFIATVVQLFKQKYDGLKYCVWDTHILNSFMIHQPVNTFHLIETDRDITESVFYYLKDNNVKAFNNPSVQIMEDYVLGEPNAVVVKPLVSRAPLITGEQIVFPALEKILVDIFCDQHQFYIFGGQEMINIFEHAFHHYSLNFSSMYAYASRRGKKALLKKFVEENVLNEQTAG